MSGRRWLFQGSLTLPVGFARISSPIRLSGCSDRLPGRLVTACAAAALVTAAAAAAPAHRRRAPPRSDAAAASDRGAT